MNKLKIINTYDQPTPNRPRLAAASRLCLPCRRRGGGAGVQDAALVTPAQLVVMIIIVVLLTLAIDRLLGVWK